MKFSEIANCVLPLPCPYPMIRVGGESDGAYLVPEDLDGIAACFSPGVSNRKDFEDELATSHGIRSHMCDYSSDIDQLRTPLIDGMQTFQKKWLDLGCSPIAMTLEDWVRTAEPAREGDGDLMLQMDIEGAEYRNLMATSSSCLKRFRIIILEIHFLGIFMHNRDSAIKASLKGLIHGLSMPLRFSLQSPHQSDLLSRIIARYDNSFRPYLIRAALRRLHQSHLCVHVHPNNCLGEFLDKETGLNVPDVIELTYLRRDRFIGDSAKFHPPQSPHPLDIINVPERPNIILNSRWIS